MIRIMTNECCKVCKIYDDCSYSDLDKLECSYITKDKRRKIKKNKR